MSNQLDLRTKLRHPSIAETAELGETIAASLEDSPHGGKGLEKMKLAKRIRGRIERGEPAIEFTASEVKMITNSLQGTRAWAYEQIIKHIDPAEWRKVMEPETEDSEEEA